ncbi:MAG: hypothetical protein WDO69_10340 [Pseudomonadota bacterium]
MAPATSSAEAEVRILRSEASHGIAFAGRTLVVLWQTETRAHAVIELATLLARLAAEFGRLGLLQVIGDHATPPDGAARSALATMLKDNETRIVASAVVFEGTGFRASVIRSIVIGISMLSRPKCPHTVFASTTAGVEWLSGQMKSSGSPHHSADDTQLAIDRLRQHARLVST